VRSLATLTDAGGDRAVSNGDTRSFMRSLTAVTDVIGQRFAPAPDARIVSLVPSITETLIALGLRAQTVGRTGFCIHPRDAVREISKVGGTKDVKLDAVRALAPTHVIVNIDENEAPTVEALRRFVPHVVVTHPNSPQDNLALYRLLGGLFGRDEAAQAMCAALQAQLDALAGERWPPETVLYLIWKDPWMTVAADTYIARSLAAVGWQVPHPPGGERGAGRYPRLDDLAAAVASVDRVLLSTEPYRFRERHAAALRPLGRPVDLIDGEWTSWYGVRAIEGLRRLAGFRRARLA
jgi:ABC-type Fe3+-hydroxamate transport system substrate-binding protein